jgi:stringent starvation protein B
MMTPLKSYLVRAIHEWILDNDRTPYLLVNAEADGVQVPPQYIEDGRIVLNLRTEATQGLSLGNEWIEFSARFGGKPMRVVVPVYAVLAIYASENGQGMVFDVEDATGNGQPPTPPEPEPPARGRPKLRVVK